MRLVALVESEAHVCTRYRLSAFRGALAAAGHSIQFRDIPHTPWGRLTLGRDFAAADAVIVQRKLLPRWTTALLRRAAPRLIFDFDDAVWLRDSYSAKGFNDPRRAARFRTMVAAADRVVAGNDYLAAEAAKHTPTRHVVVIPTCVNVDRTTPRTGPNPNPVLVWVGSSSTLRGLEQFTPTLTAIGRAVPGIRLKLICDRFMSVPGLPVETTLWNEATEAAEIASASIGIGWVPDDPWSRGKCGLKVLQYQAAALPVIANPVGVQAVFVQDGVTGYCATTTDEWVSAVRRLTADPALAMQLGGAGRTQVERQYSVTTGAAQWRALLDELNGQTLSRKTG